MPEVSARLHQSCSRASNCSLDSVERRQMAALTAVMVYEKIGRAGERVTPFVGVALLTLAALVVIHPAWLPPVFSSR